MTTESTDILNVKELADVLQSNKTLEFKHKGLYYQIFESIEFGYVVNLYSSDEKDEDGDYLDCNLIDGGLCTGSAIDAVEFML